MTCLKCHLHNGMLLLCLLCHSADNEGPWSKKEVQRLLRAVRDHVVSKIPGGADNYDSVRVTKEVLYKRLPLMKISKKVKTRSWTQCREKW